MKHIEGNFKNSICHMVLFCFVCGLSGCLVPCAQSASVSGYVKDAATQEAIAGAEIEMRGKPKTKTISDANGFFKTKPYDRLAIALIPFVGDTFYNEDVDIQISHPNYGCQAVHASGIGFLTPDISLTDPVLIKCTQNKK